MAYGEKLQLIDMLAAMEMKQRSENESENRAAQAKLLAEQTKSMQEANKLAELKRSMLTPTGMPNAKDSVYSIGYPEYAKRQEKMQLLSQMTGSPLPSHGFRGGGGGYGRGGDDRGQEQPVNPYPDGVRGTGPDSAQAAAALGEIYRPGGQEPTQAPMSIAELLADERGNVAGGQSLIDQRNTMGGTPVASPTWETPVQGAVNDENQLKDTITQTFLNQGGTSVPPKQLSPEEQLAAVNAKNAQREKERAMELGSKNRSAARKREDDEFKTYQNKVYSDKYFQELDADAQEKILALIHHKTRQAIKKNMAVNIPAILKTYIDGYGE